MKPILEAIARWIDNADAGDITAILFVGGMGVIGVLMALTCVVHGFPK